MAGLFDSISIHALREEGDIILKMHYFYEAEISIHALREEGDTCIVLQKGRFVISIHTLREEGD